MAGRGGGCDRAHGLARTPAQSARRRRACRVERPRSNLRIPGTRRTVRSDRLLRAHRTAPRPGRDPGRRPAQAQATSACADPRDCAIVLVHETALGFDVLAAHRAAHAPATLAAPLRPPDAAYHAAARLAAAPGRVLSEADSVG